MCMYVHMCVYVPLYQAKEGLGKAHRVILRTSSRQYSLTGKATLGMVYMGQLSSGAKYINTSVYPYLPVDTVTRKRSAQFLRHHKSFQLGYQCLGVWVTVLTWVENVQLSIIGFFWFVRLQHSASSKQAESEGVAEGRGLFTNSHKSLATCIPPNWSFVVITVNTSVHVRVFTVTSTLFTYNCV